MSPTVYDCDTINEPVIKASPVNGKGVDGTFVNCDPSPPKDPVNNPYDAVAVPLPDKFLDAVISARTALLPDKMTFFQFGIYFSYYGWLQY